MRRTRPLSFVLLLGLAAEVALAASLDEAWTLYLGGELEAAAAELSAVLAAGEPTERAEALSLAGTVAAARGDLAGARRLWSEAAERHLERPAGREAAAKLDLLCAVTECPPAGGTTAAVPAHAGPPATARAAPTPAAPAPPAPAPPPAPAAPAARAPGVAPAPAAQGTIVLVAGQGTPFEAVLQATDLLTEFLRQHGVDARSPTDEIAVVHRAEVVVGQLLDAARDRGAAAVVVIDAQFGHRERVQVTCWNADGAVLWSESVTGGTGLVRPIVMNRNLMDRLTAKLVARIDGPGLPIAR
jgi:hypothetical protein